MIYTDHAMLNSAFMDNVLIFVASPLLDLYYYGLKSVKEFFIEMLWLMSSAHCSVFHVVSSSVGNRFFDLN